MQVYLEMGRLFLVFKEMRAYGVRKVYELQWDEEKNGFSYAEKEI